ncbi:ComF family protein [candidate division KSB1 bacterium]|nr:ComF family protein [candidate division KSB1 bacterium]
MPIVSDLAWHRMVSRRAGQNARLWLSALVDFIYPPLCLLCDEALVAGEQSVCRKCWTVLPSLYPAEQQAGELNPEFCFDFSIAAFDYQDSMQTLIHAVKYRGYRRLIPPLADELAQAAGDALRLWKANALVAVPLHPARRRERGYNQAELLAERIGVRLSLPVYSLLRRTRYTAPQAQRSRLERRENVAGAFSTKRAAVLAGKRLVLIDDVLTTGNTVDACARVLLESGASAVAVLTLARAR